MVFLRGGAAAAPAHLPPAGPAPPEPPAGGSRRDKGGSGFLAEQRRLRAVREAQATTSPAKHCWVRDPRWPGRHPGLLLAWEQTDDGWRGRVAIVPDHDAELLVALVAAVYLENAQPRTPAPRETPDTSWQ